MKAPLIQVCFGLTLVALVALAASCGNTPGGNPTSPGAFTATPTATGSPTPTPGAFLGQWGASGSGSGKFNNPQGVAVNSAGTTVYVTDSGDNLVQYFSPVGIFLGQWGGLDSVGGLSPNPGKFKSTNGVAVNSAGTTIYVTDATEDF
ncbi:MAG TPA: hypothetical protein VN963_03300, partial [bacterium]|nr:hypothetical protein [bacterium]